MFLCRFELQIASRGIVRNWFEWRIGWVTEVTPRAPQMIDQTLAGGLNLRMELLPPQELRDRDKDRRVGRT